jgi:hypothetical protein
VVLEKESRIKSSQRFGSLVKIYKEMKYLKKYEDFKIKKDFNPNDYLSNNKEVYDLVIVKESDNYSLAQKYLIDKGLYWITGENEIVNIPDHLKLVVSYFHEEDTYAMILVQENPYLYKVSEIFKLYDTVKENELISGKCSEFFDKISMDSMIEAKKLGLM